MSQAPSPHSHSGPSSGSSGSSGSPTHGGRPDPHASTESSLSPSEGWHCNHLFYSFDRAALKSLSATELTEGQEAFVAALDSSGNHAPARLQSSIVAGGKADFALMILDPDPLKVDSVHQRLLASPLGPALRVSYSFVSMTEVSEYVPTLEAYGKRLVAEGESDGSPAYNAKLKAYAAREEAMRVQRLTPDFPAWPNTCFYPMNKKRKVGENWFSLTFAERNALMAEHAKSGIKFAGRVTQLITASVGLDDWEWGVTLWARRPEFLKEIVYTMRFDEASARYAEFGPFYTSFIASAEKILEHCRV